MVKSLHLLDVALAVKKWTGGQLVFRSSYYTGRGPKFSDLNSDMLEGIYLGLRSEVGQQEAMNFVNFVDNLHDLSASAFIQAFERFWMLECKQSEILQPEGSGDQITGRGDERYTEGFVLIAEALSGNLKSPNAIRSESLAIKAPFLKQHRAEITALR